MPFLEENLATFQRKFRLGRPMDFFSKRAARGTFGSI